MSALSINFLLLALFAPQFFQQATDPEHVVLMGCELTALPPGSNATLTLNLAYNYLTALPNYTLLAASYRNLETLNLAQNRIASIAPTAFRGLRHLRALDLAANNLTALDAYTFKHLARLASLDLSRNALRLHETRLLLIAKSLATLRLAHNRIAAVYEVSFVGVANLEHLLLDHNPIAAIEPGSFAGLRKLQLLSLAGTRVARLGEGMFGARLPLVINVEESVLAKRFEPPLRKLTGNAIGSLLEVDKYVFGDAP